VLLLVISRKERRSRNPNPDPKRRKPSETSSYRRILRLLYTTDHQAFVKPQTVFDEKIIRQESC
jgi:hypothetical protein